MSYIRGIGSYLFVARLLNGKTLEGACCHLFKEEFLVLSLVLTFEDECRCIDNGFEASVEFD
jgi:hypothetical protein